MATLDQNNMLLYQKIAGLLQSARQSIVRSINHTMVHTYFEIGRMIVEDEQQGKERADYGKQVLKTVSKDLTKEFGRGFSVDNLENMRKLFLAYSLKSELSKSETLSRISEATHIPEFSLSWSHYLKLLRVDNPEERGFYELEAAQNNWSLREMQRQIDSALYERLALSRDKEQVKALAYKGQVIEKPQDAIKDPMILEFVGFPEKAVYSESALEQQLIDKLEHFLLELLWKAFHKSSYVYRIIM